MSIKTKIEYEIKALQDKLRYVTQFDMWDRWSREDEQRLEALRAKLEEFKI